MTDLAEVLRQPLDEGNEGRDGAPLTVGSEDLERLWSGLVPDSYAGRRGLEVFLEAVQASASATGTITLRPTEAARFRITLA